MLLPDEIDPKSIRDQLDSWEIEINQALGDPPPERFQQEMRNQHGPKIERWIQTLEQVRDQLQPNHGRGAHEHRDPDDLSPPGVANSEDAVTVAEIYSLIGYLRSQIGRSETFH
jgi:hypothetical protein